MKAYEAKISDLSDDQKSHLAWRIHHCTYVGFITTGRIARGEMGNSTLLEVFTKAGMSEHQAKIHARKVCDFQVTPEQRRTMNDATARLLQKLLKMKGNNNASD